MQSKTMSLLESVANVLIGYVIATLSQIVIFPWFGINVPLGTNLAIGGCFTVVSIARSYVLRRYFNGLRLSQKNN